MGDMEMDIKVQLIVIVAVTEAAMVKGEEGMMQEDMIEVTLDIVNAYKKIAALF